MLITLDPCAYAAAAHAPWEAPDLNKVTVKAPPRHPPVVLVSREVTNGAIYVCGNAGAAGTELQAFIREATGVKLPLIAKTDGNQFASPAIILGDNPEALAIGLNGSNMPPEGFAIKTAPGRVYIVGDVVATRANGILWGASEFAERYLGVRWYFPQASLNGPELGRDIPRTTALIIPPAWIEDAPFFRMREIFPPWSNPWQGNGIELHKIQSFLRAGSSWNNKLLVHKPNWASDADLVKNHPEVFQKRQDGVRQLDVLCYGNPGTLEIYLEGVQNFIDNKPPYYAPIAGKSITVSPADVELACYCADCRKLWDNNGGQHGMASKIMAAFTDKLAREVLRRWPTNDFTVVFLPYLNYTRAPDGFKFPGNVEVQICGMPGMACYKEPALMEAEIANVDKWMAISGRKIQNWHYNVWPAHKTKAAYHYCHVIKNYYQRNRAKTVGTFINGDFNHWPRQHISMYCWLKVLWNPDFDVDAAIPEFSRRMFGKAAPTMARLLDMQLKGWEQSRWPGGLFSPKGIYETSFPSNDVAKMKALLAQAFQEAAGDQLVIDRIEYTAPSLRDFFAEAELMTGGKGFRPLAAQKVGENPVIDGKLDDPVWERAKANSFVVARGGQPPVYPTTVKAVWTADGITFGFRMREPAPGKLYTGNGGHDNGGMWWDDNVEIIVDVSGQQLGTYYHFIINPAGDYWDSRLKDTTFECAGFKHKSFLGPDFWSMEVFLPYAAFPKAKKPGSGTHTKWAGNFTRHRMADRNQKAPGNSWAAGSVPEYQRMNTTGAATSDNLADLSAIEFIE